MRTISLAKASVFPLLVLLAGCHAVVLDPSGDVALQQRNLILISTALMLVIIIPVMALTVLFAWRYRHTNKSATYDPEWHHSTQLELVIWAAPLLIIICLGALTWMSTHILDPYRQIARVGPDQALTAGIKPLQVDVVALDWKWLFIYPELGIATVNDLAAPVDRPIDFRITSSTVMNSFYVPALAGQIYAMPGMETKLHAVINKPGEYEGFSANYSGAGFSGMHFHFHGQSEAEFAAWVRHVKQSGETIDRAQYLRLEQPSENDPVRDYAAVAPDLYHAILNMCVETGKMCMDDMMRIDAKGGLGLAGISNVMPLEYDKYAGRGSVVAPHTTYLAAICTPMDHLGVGTSEPAQPLASQPSRPLSTAPATSPAG
jgi:cytochrome o ubiquinol oxidase subunit 2